MTNIIDHKKLIYVVQFLNPPFKNIDKYVCVPSSWVIFQKSSKQKGNVTYPTNEDPSDTRTRIKRREQPNDDWKFYPALIKYGSEYYKDAKHWILRNSCYQSDEEELVIRDTQRKPEQNKKPRREVQPSSSGFSSDKPEFTLKTDSSPRKPLPKISMRQLLSQNRDENLNKDLNEDPKPSIVTDHVTAASDYSKQEQSIIITSNQLIQEDQMKTSSGSNGKVNTDQNTQSADVKKNRSAKMSIQSISSKLLANQQQLYQLFTEEQQSRQPPTEQQQSQQPLPNREPPLQSPIDRQPSLKLMAEQHTSSKLSGDQQPSRVGEDYQQLFSGSVVDLDESNGKIDISQNVLPAPVTDGRPSTKTPPSTLKPAPQPDPINERQTPLAYHEHSLLKPYSRVLFAGQSKESNYCQNTHFHGISTASTIISRPSNTTNQPSQQYGGYQLSMSSVGNNLNSKLQPQESFGKSSVKVTDNQSIRRFQNIIDSITSTSHDDPNLVKLSQMLKIEVKKLFPAMKEWINSVDKKNSLEGITKNIPTVQYPSNSMRQDSLPNNSTDKQSTQFAQYHLPHAQVDDSRMNDVRSIMSQKDPLPQNITNTSTTQNILMLAEQKYPVLKRSHEQQNLLTREDYLQQSICQQDMFGRPTMTSTLNQNVYHQNAMINRGIVLQSQPNFINQPIQILPQNGNQYVPINNVHAQEINMHELMKRSTDRAHIIDNPVAQKEVNIQFPPHNSSSQSHQDAELSQQKQDHQNYRDPSVTNRQNNLLFTLKRSSHNPEPQKITKRSRSLPPSNTSTLAFLDTQKSSFFQKLGLQERVNQSSKTCNNTNLAAVSESHQSNHDYQHPSMKKTMVAEASETNSMMDVDYSVEAIAGSTISKSAPKVVESARQTDEWLRKEQASFCEKTASGSKNSSEHEIELENEVVTKANQTILTAGQNITPKNKHVQSRICIEQDIMDVSSTLFTQMDANLAFARDMFDCLRNSIISCAQAHETLLKKIMKFNSIEPFQISTSPPNNVVSQVTQEKPTRDNDNATIISSAATSIRQLRGTFSLPAEYDPNDTRWTLKYREKKPGLVELIPKTGVYVKRKELKRCIQESSDCRTLARLLLTEVFSQIALSVCSWTGGKAKAFQSANIDVRPGLDEDARIVLLTFVEQHGEKHGWSTTDTSAIMSTIRTKMKDMRHKHEQIGKA